jgi:hypothetical protein
MAVKSCHEVLELRAVQSFTAAVSPAPIFPTFGADAGVPATTNVHPFGTTAATTSTHAHAVTFGFCAFVAEPTHPPSNALQPAITPATATTKARST